MRAARLPDAEIERRGHRLEVQGVARQDERLRAAAGGQLREAEDGGLCRGVHAAGVDVQAGDEGGEGEREGVGVDVVGGRWVRVVLAPGCVRG